MVVSIPQFNNFTMSASYPNDRTPAFDGKVGGFFAIAVNGTCNLVNGKIDLRTDVAASKADSITTHSPTLNERSSLLSLGQGLGSALILARNLTMSANTRLGGLNSGAQLGGCGFTASATVEGGGYRGHDSANGSALGGHGGAGGHGNANGGYLSNGDSNSGLSQGRQGAHVLIIADTITDFNIAALSLTKAASDGYYCTRKEAFVYDGSFLGWRRQSRRRSHCFRGGRLDGYCQAALRRVRYRPLQLRRHIH